MINMTMREQDGFDGIRLEAKFANQPADQEGFTDPSGVHHHACIASLQQMAATHDPANRVDAEWNIAHERFIALVSSS